MRTPSIFEVGFCTIAVLLGLLALCTGQFVDVKDVARSVEAAGYSEPRVIAGHRFFVGWYGCSTGDAAVFEFEVTNPRNERVKIIACSGWPFKATTIRVP